MVHEAVKDSNKISTLTSLLQNKQIQLPLHLISPFQPSVALPLSGKCYFSTARPRKYLPFLFLLILKKFLVSMLQHVHGLTTKALLERACWNTLLPFSHSFDALSTGPGTQIRLHNLLIKCCFHHYNVQRKPL